MHSQLPNWSKVRRLSLIRREVRESLSPEALRLIFHHAEVMVEGSVEQAPRFGPRVYATVMLTVDLEGLGTQLDEVIDELTTLKISELIRRDPRVHREIARLACRHVHGRDLDLSALGPYEIDIRTTAEGSRVLIDGDAMVSLAPGREMTS